MDRYAREKSFIVVETVADRGDSGANSNRAGLLRVLELARAGKIDLVVGVWRDRLFRDIYARRSFEQDLAEYGVRTLALNDTGSRIGDGVLDLLAEQQREDMAEKVRNGRRGKPARASFPVAGGSPGGSGSARTRATSRWTRRPWPMFGRSSRQLG